MAVEQLPIGLPIPCASFSSRSTTGCNWSVVNGFVTTASTAPPSAGCRVAGAVGEQDHRRQVPARHAAQRHYAGDHAVAILVVRTAVEDDETRKHQRQHAQRAPTGVSLTGFSAGPLDDLRHHDAVDLRVADDEHPGKVRRQPMRGVAVGEIPVLVETWFDP